MYSIILDIYVPYAIGYYWWHACNFHGWLYLITLSLPCFVVHVCEFFHMLWSLKSTVMLVTKGASIYQYWRSGMAHVVFVQVLILVTFYKMCLPLYCSSAFFLESLITIELNVPSTKGGYWVQVYCNLKTVKYITSTNLSLYHSIVINIVCITYYRKA